MTDYRIEFTIQRRRDGQDDFTDVGFGSSGSWGSIAGASHMTETLLSRREWETEPGMPEPEDVDAEDSDDQPEH